MCKVINVNPMNKQIQLLRKFYFKDGGKEIK